MNVYIETPTASLYDTQFRVYDDTDSPNQNRE